ncbi:uncharacterized protein LOC121262054 [Juglans microcarpa x Juglans regia]|uniref:uncharacterized protein LOC121262054 n=1 Tax=Juglans microcarpa x Juglans regia TaxID=2249226 RepID=UPI001B7F7625|nr:uncharacterized protein LOC121262054 [Juglans microcarpa x Juglans regia]
MVSAIKATTEFNDANKKASRTGAELNANTVNWTPPSQGLYKVNWDASLSKRSSKVGTGIIVRDHEGHVIATKMMKFGLKIGIRKIILEGDALNVVNYIKQRGFLPLLGAIIRDIKNVLAQLDYWEVVHIRRGSNI